MAPPCAGRGLRDVAGARDPRAADHPQAGRRPVRRDGGGRRLRRCSAARGGRTRCSPGSCRAPRRSCLRLHRVPALVAWRSSRSRQSPPPQAPGSTTGRSTTPTSRLTSSCSASRSWRSPLSSSPPSGRSRIERSLRRCRRPAGIGAPERRAHGRAAPGQSGRRAPAFTYAGSPRPAFRDVELEVEPGAVLLVVGPVRLGQEHARPGARGPAPERVPRRLAGIASGRRPSRCARSGRARRHPPPTPPRARRRDRPPGSREPAGHGACRRRRGVRAGEPRPGRCAAMRPRVPEALAAVGSGGFEGRRSTRLSGGEQQRVAIAGVLAPAPGPARARRADGEPRSGRRRGGRRGSSRALREQRPRRSCWWSIEPRSRGPLPTSCSRSTTTAARSTSDRRRTSWRAPAKRSRRPGSGCRRRGSARATAAAPRQQVPAAGHASGRSRSSSCVTCASGSTAASRYFGTIDLSVAPGERVALVGAERQRQDDAASARARAAPAAAGEVRLGRGDPWRLPALQLARLAGYVVQDPGARLPRRYGPRGDRAGTRRRAGPLRPRALRAARAPAGAVRRPQPVPALRRRAAPPLARDRRSPAGRSCSPWTSRRTARIGAATRPWSRRSTSWSGRGAPCSRPPTTSASSATPTDRRVELAGGWIVAEDAASPAAGSAR